MSTGSYVGRGWSTGVGGGEVDGLYRPEHTWAAQLWSTVEGELIALEHTPRLRRGRGGQGPYPHPNEVPPGGGGPNLTEAEKRHPQAGVHAYVC